jgi:aconitase B
MNAIFDGLLLEVFGGLGLLVESAFEATEAGAEEDHAGAVEEHREADAGEYVRIIPVWFAPGIKHDVEFFRKRISESEESAINCSDRVLNVGPLLLDRGCTIKLGDNFMGDD